MDSTVLFNAEDWSVKGITDRDGKAKKVIGFIVDQDGRQRCPTEKCGALCCVEINWKGENGKRCEFLSDDLGCMFHEERGMSCKPVSCAAWPRQQLDIDFVNERWADGEKRCYLKVVDA